LPEIVVIPRSVIIEELTAVWNKYNQLLKNKKEKDFPMQIYYYRQMTQNDDLYTEYMECFFTAPTTIRIQALSLQAGRFARIKKDSIGGLKNFFMTSQMTPISLHEASKEKAINPFLVKDFNRLGYFGKMIFNESNNETDQSNNRGTEK